MRVAVAQRARAAIPGNDPESFVHMKYRVLGPIQVADDDGGIRVPGGGKQRLLLAGLLHHGNRVISTDRLISVLWHHDTPDDPGGALRTQVSRLRAFLAEAGAGAAALKSEAYGYRLAVDPDAVDAARFEAILEQAGRSEDPRHRLALLDEALTLWRGEPFEEFADLTHFLGEVTRLRELHAGARERRVDALLECGRTSDALAAAERLVREEPLRERPRALLMAALYEAGRASEALAAFQEFRRTLSEELGLDPSPSLRQLEGEILRHERPVRAPHPAVPMPVEGDESQGADASDRASLPEPLARTAPPVPLTPLIGRGQELASVRRLLDSSRLVTLTGAGGSGKTRFALELAAHLREREGRNVVWVGLESLADAELVPQEVAAALGVRERVGQSLRETLARALGPRDVLLCLDNCEHLVEACAHLTEWLLRGCPGLRVLTTSREPLGVRGELTWPVPPLPVPEEGVAEPDALLAVPSVQVFVERASAASPAFRVTPENAPAVAGICRRLDGMPLALELAAARVRTMPVQEIVKRLDRSFLLLTAGSRTALPRHRTLRAAIDWSYQLLSDPERRMLERLSVFTGGFSLEAVEAVCGAAFEEDLEDSEHAGNGAVDLFSGLVDRSLIVVGAAGNGTRYRLLETVREYAGGKLAEREGEGALRRQHAEFFTDLAEAAEPHLLGAEGTTWTDRLAADQDNLRAALAWTREAVDTGSPQAAGAVELQARMVAALWWFWHARGQVGEARVWLERALDLPVERVPEPVRAALLYGGAMAAWVGGDLPLARIRAPEALAAARRLDDARALSRALGTYAWVLRDAGDLTKAIPAADECAGVARGAGLDAPELAFALWIQGSVHSTAGNLVLARDAQEEALRIWRSAGVGWGLSQVLHGLGVIALERGDLEEAMDRFREALAALGDDGDPYWTCRGLEGLAAGLACRGEDARAARLLGAAEALREAIGTPLLAFETPRHLRTVEGLRVRLGPEVFAAASAQGGRWLQHEAVAYALAEEEPLLGTVPEGAAEE